MFNIKPITKHMEQKKYDVLCKTIYKNFSYLSKFTELKHNLNEIGRILHSDGLVGFELYHDNVIIGYVIGELMTISDGRFVTYIYYLYIVSSYRSKGYGTKLLKAVYSHADYSGSKFIMLTCNNNDTTLITYYKKNGFIQDVYQHNIYPFIVMTKFLD